MWPDWSPKHSPKAVDISLRLIMKLSLYWRQFLSKRIIFSLKSSLFSGKGWQLILATRSLMMRSVSSFLRWLPPLMINSRIFKVVSRLFSIGSLRVYIRFLAKCEFSKSRSQYYLGLFLNSLKRVSRPDLRIFLSWSVRQLIDLWRLWAKILNSWVSISKIKFKKYIQILARSSMVFSNDPSIMLKQ